MKTMICLLGLVTTVLMLVAFVPESTPRANGAAALGQQLFLENLLSKDSSISCASCHQPQFAFADTAALSIGINGKPTRRNTPSVLNMASRGIFYWDGRAESLEQQALMPIEHPNEMGLPLTEAVARLNAIPSYVKAFKAAFGQRPNAQNIGLALAAFEKTLETDSSKLDMWEGGDGPVALTDAEERGRQLFVGDKAKCFDCHFTPDFTGDEFKNIGLYDGKTLADAGRFIITEKPEDLGKFKVPGLRNVAATAPYMHNGMFKTLEEVVSFYNNPRAVVANPINIDSSLAQPLGLTAQEQADLVAFMHTLTDKRYAR
ncbi:MAG: cytochrome-c peroxidase [Bacteroidetes bacterium]|nr:MAG: cytochrome-c peroxidase [Bacteroidota bacterium]